MNPGPASSSVMGAGFAPVMRRALYHVRIIGNVAVVQGIVQGIGFLSGILIIRSLTQQEYAYFTIANTMQGTLNLLADIGISAGVVSIGGRGWQGQSRLRGIINTGVGPPEQLALVVFAFVISNLFLLPAR